MQHDTLARDTAADDWPLLRPALSESAKFFFFYFSFKCRRATLVVPESNPFVLGKSSARLRFFLARARLWLDASNHAFKLTFGT